MGKKIMPTVCVIGLALSNVPTEIYAVSTNSADKVDFLKRSESESINIKDENLLIAINESLNKEDLYSNVMLEDILCLEVLDLSNKEIRNLNGLEFATNLRSLDLSDNNISDIEPLSNLINLESLDLSKNHIANISVINKLSKIKNLSVSNQVIGMESVNVIDQKFALKNPIKKLNGESVVPTYISEEGSLKDSEVLWDNLNQDVTQLEIEFNEEINVGEKKVGHFDGRVIQPIFIEEFVDIKDESLAKEINGLLNKKDLSSKILKSEMESIEILNINNPKIESLEGLEYAVNLKELSITNTNIKDFEAVSKLYGLVKLDLSNNNIENIDFLVGMDSLEYLNLQGNNLGSLDNVYIHLNNLKELNLSHNNLYQINLEGLDSLIKLDVSNNFISNLEGISQLFSLQNLDASNNSISDISSLSQIEGLLDVNFENQTIYLPKVNVNQRMLKIKNPILNIDKSTVNPGYISEEGLSEEDFVYWKDVNGELNSLEFEFIEYINLNGTTLGNFTGKVIQPLEVDLFAQEDYISISLSTNQIRFDDYSGLEDVENVNAIQMNVDSNKAYDVSILIPTEIKNSDGTKQISVGILGVKESGFSEYTNFKNINEKIILLEDMAPGVNSHSFDFRLNKDVISERDSYRAVARFEVSQK